jgi:hypothetical protein
MNAEQFFKSAKVIKEAYDSDGRFRDAVKASILSAMKELKGSCSDEQVAIAIAERLFGDG